MVTVDPDALRREATQWVTLADDMAEIRSVVESQLWLGVSAFFIGNFTELIHHPAYRDFHGRMVARLRGGQTEFELIGLVLNRLAEEYEETDRLQRDKLTELYSVTEQDVASVTDDGVSTGRAPGSRSPGHQQHT